MSLNNTYPIATFKKDVDGVIEIYEMKIYKEDEIILFDKDGNIKISVNLYGQKIKDVFIRMLPSLNNQGYILIDSIF